MNTSENNVAAQAGDEPMRAAFEEWMAEKWFRDFRRNANGDYIDERVMWAWEGFYVSSRATADVERIATECMEALAIGYVEFDEDLDENVCADCSTPTGSEWGDHTPDCLVIRAREAIATTKIGA